MKQKIITALCISLLFSVVFGSQIAQTAKADTKDGHPLTSPLTFFTINGNITYQFFTLFRHGKQDDPASGVTVKAENIITHTVYETTTDTNGNYSISTEEAGTFLVSPSGGKTSVYVPPVISVKANHLGSKNNVDFKGYILP